MTSSRPGPFIRKLFGFSRLHHTRLAWCIIIISNEIHLLSLKKKKKKDIKSIHININGIEILLHPVETGILASRNRWRVTHGLICECASVCGRRSLCLHVCSAHSRYVLYVA